MYVYPIDLDYRSISIASTLYPHRAGGGGKPRRYFCYCLAVLVRPTGTTTINSAMAACIIGAGVNTPNFIYGSGEAIESPWWSHGNALPLTPTRNPKLGPDA